MADPFKLNLSKTIESPLSQDSTDIQVGLIYPNPFNNTANLGFKLAKPGKVKGILFNALGMEIQEVINKDFEIGSYEIKLNGINLSQGFYNLLFTYTNDQTKVAITRKMMIKK